MNTSATNCIVNVTKAPATLAVPIFISLARTLRGAIVGCASVLLLATATAVFAAPQGCPANMVSYWRLDEGVGVAAADHADAHDGVLMGGANWTTGQVGNAVSLDGIDDYVDTGDFAIPGNQLTLEAWVKPARDQRDSHVISKWNWGDPNQISYVLIAEAGTAAWRGARLVIYANGRVFEHGAGIALPVGVWTHLVGVYNGAAIELYVDGVLKSSVGASGNLPASVGVPVYLGARFNAAGPLDLFEGAIDEAAIYNRALTSDEILQHYQDGLSHLGYCVPQLSCVGFGPPMDSGTVTVKKNRALPLKAELLDVDGLPVTDANIPAPPVLQVIYALGTPSALDVTDAALPVGLGTEGNQFEFADGQWRFNLKTKEYKAPGVYTITMVPGGEYAIDTCTAEFAIQ